jgi:hypothetical protein
VLSGIYPIVSKEVPNVNCEYIQSMGFRHNDGKISKIKALVLKNSNRMQNPQNHYASIEMTMQDLINTNIDSQQLNIDSNIPGTTSSFECSDVSLMDIIPVNRSNKAEIEYLDEAISSNSQNQILDAIELNEPYVGNENSSHSYYYHKKIRNERRISIHKDYEQKLPKITEVFSKFNDVTQPIYVQVDNESEQSKYYYYKYAIFFSKTIYAILCYNNTFCRQHSSIICL